MFKSESQYKKKMRGAKLGPTAKQKQLQVFYARVCNAAKPLHSFNLPEHKKLIDLFIKSDVILMLGSWIKKTDTLAWVTTFNAELVEQIDLLKDMDDYFKCLQVIENDELKQGIINALIPQDEDKCINRFDAVLRHGATYVDILDFHATFLCEVAPMMDSTYVGQLLDDLEDEFFKLDDDNPAKTLGLEVVGQISEAVNEADDISDSDSDEVPCEVAENKEDRPTCNIIPKDEAPECAEFEATAPQDKEEKFVGSKRKTGDRETPLPESGAQFMLKVDGKKPIKSSQPCHKSTPLREELSSTSVQEDPELTVFDATAPQVKKEKFVGSKRKTGDRETPLPELGAQSMLKLGGKKPIKLSQPCDKPPPPLCKPEALKKEPCFRPVQKEGSLVKVDSSTEVPLQKEGRVSAFISLATVFRTMSVTPSNEDGACMEVGNSIEWREQIK